MARQAAQTGAGVQQTAAGQAATMQATQSLNALGQAGNLASTQAGQQIAGTSANTSAQLGEQSALLGANQGYNTNQVAMQSNINTANAGLANTAMQGQQGLLGGVGNAVGGATGLFAKGGQVKSSFGQFLKSQPMAKGGKVDILVSPGEKLLSPNAVEQVKKGANPMKVGETVKGKPKVGGAKNSYANDTVPKKAAVGTIVVPRSETKSKDPERSSADFVSKTLAKRKRK
jgi:hypothetical protein